VEGPPTADLRVAKTLAVRPVRCSPHAGIDPSGCNSYGRFTQAFDTADVKDAKTFARREEIPDFASGESGRERWRERSATVSWSNGLAESGLYASRRALPGSLF
jgi:hypothetical protein